MSKFGIKQVTLAEKTNIHKQIIHNQLFKTKEIKLEYYNKIKEYFSQLISFYDTKEKNNNDNIVTNTNINGVSEMHNIIIESWNLLKKVNQKLETENEQLKEELQNLKQKLSELHNKKKSQSKTL